MRDFATDSDPHEVFAQKERVTAVRAAMQKLSEEHRTVIVLRDIEGASYETIADRIQESLINVTSFSSDIWDSSDGCIGNFWIK